MIACWPSGSGTVPLHQVDVPTLPPWPPLQARRARPGSRRTWAHWQCSCPRLSLLSWRRLSRLTPLWEPATPTWRERTTAPEARATAPGGQNRRAQPDASLPNA